MAENQGKGGLVISRESGEGINIIDRRSGEIIQVGVTFLPGRGNRVQLRICADKERYVIIRDSKDKEGEDTNEG